MKNNILKMWSSAIVLGCLFLFPGRSILAEEKCSTTGYSIISINGMLTTAKGAVYNKNMLSGALKMKSYNNQKIIYDYVYNPTHGFFADFIDAMTQKTSEKMFISDTHDLKDMLVDLSAKVKTQKLLIVAHSQGNFYANDFYRVLGDVEGGISKSSMGVYGVGTPTSYIAGNGKYILSKNDSIINKIRLIGMIDVLPSNVDIPLDPDDDLKGHGLVKTYLKYQSKRIASEILTSLHYLKDDPEQDPNKPCINPPDITMLDETIGLVYKVLDPIEKTIEDTGKLVVNNLVKPALNTVVKFGKSYMKLVNSLFSTASLSLEDNKEVEKEDNVQEIIDEYIEDEEEYEKNKNNLLVEKEDEKKGSVSNQTEENKTIAVISKTRISGGSHRSGTVVENEELEEDDEEESEQEGENGDSEEGQEGEENEGENNEPEENNNEEEDEEEETENPTEAGDIVPPVIFLVGEENLKLAKGSEYVEQGATANDDKDGKVDVVISGVVDVDTEGTYIIYYKAKDKTGNESVKERSIKIYTPLPGLLINENTELPAGEYFFDNVTITNNATLTLLTNTTSIPSSFRGVRINANNLTVDSGSSISSNNQGFLVGPGTNSENQAGGSYGGMGEGSNESFIYGSTVRPKEIGSGGAIYNYHYKGGGAIWIDVEDTLINNGAISANGGFNASGGSIYVNTKNLEGNGSFNADGGGLTSTSIFYYPGGGGRVAIHYDNSFFTGKVEANAGCGHIGYPNLDCGEDGTAGLFDKKNKILYIDKHWEFIKEDNIFEIERVEVSDMAQIRFQKGAKIKVKDFVMKDSSVMKLTGEEDFDVDNLVLEDNSRITTFNEKILEFTVDNLTIGSNATITVDSLGLSSGPGTPEPEYWNYTGASYGGKGGGTNSKTIYGDKNYPLDFGSGTEGFSGGGAMHIIVRNNLVNDGRISADGYWRRTSGGSIYIETNNLSGNGGFFARGGNGLYQDSPTYGIAGGGGRIAIYYKEKDFTGQINANAGDFCFYGCAPGGQNGTVVEIDTDEPVEEPVLSKENNILSFKFESLSPVITGDINSENNTIYATVPFETNITYLAPTILISPNASLDKDSLSPQDFTNPVSYKVTAQDGSLRNYIVTVNKENEDTEIPIDEIPPLITEYTINGTTEDIIIDPMKEDVLIEIKSGENVDWVSIIIEKIEKPEVDKRFYSSAGCEDWTSTCSKVWRGEISNSSYMLEEGDYHVKVHIKDQATNSTHYTLPSVIKVRKE